MITVILATPDFFSLSFFEGLFSKLCPKQISWGAKHTSSALLSKVRPCVKTGGGGEVPKQKLRMGLHLTNCARF